MTDVVVSSPLLTLNPDDHSALIIIATICLSLVTTASIIAKALIHRYTGLSVHSFDALLVLAWGMVVGEAVLTVLAANDGLGRHTSAVGADIEKVQKLQYGASILALAAVSCSKVCSCLLIKHINNYGMVRRAAQMTLLLILASFVSALVATIFQCPLPRPWRPTSPSECPSIAPIYLYRGVMSIITDVMLCLLSVAMVWDVKTDLHNKILVIGLFFTRIACLITLIPSLLSSDYLYQDKDSTWLAVGPTLWQQSSYHLSVITACIPTMKDLFDMFSGTLSAAIDTPYELNTVAGKIKATAIPDGHLGLVSRKPSQSTFCTSNVRSQVSRNLDGDTSAESDSVQNLTEGVIYVTDEVECHYENRGSISSGETTTHGRPAEVVGTHETHS